MTTFAVAYKREPQVIRLRRPGQARMQALVDGTRKRMNKLVLDYSTGNLGGRQFGQAMDKLLLDRHTRAAKLGRNRAGDMAPSLIDQIEGHRVMQGERAYLRKFTQDLLDGRYTDPEAGVDSKAVLRRAHSYAGRMSGTANEAFVSASAAYLLTWHLGAVEEHCDDCPRYAAGSPYKWDEMPTVPGANATQCKFNCACSLKRSDGVTGFSPVE